MSKLLDELRSILTSHHLHVTSQPNQGTAHLIEAHLKRLDAVAADVATADAEAHRVLGELYGALNAPAPAEDTPAPPSAPAKAPRTAKTAPAAETPTA